MSEPPGGFSQPPPAAGPPPSPAAPPPRPGREAAPASPPSPSGYAGLPAFGWTPITVLFGVLTAIGIMVFATFPLALFDPELDSTAGKDLAQLMVALGLGGAALIFATADAGGRIGEALRRLGFRGIALRIAGMAVLAWLAYVALAALASPLLDPEQQDITREIGAEDDTALNLVIGGFLIVIAAPVSEELFFRGFMFAGLRKRMPIWTAAGISALIWGSLHLTGGNVGVAIQLAIFGVVLAFLYERSGTLWAPIIAHGINNTIAFVLLASDAV